MFICKETANVGVIRGQGSARTSYLCPQCYQLQLQESKGRLQGGEQTGTKSQFYLAAEPAAYQSLTKLPTCRLPGSSVPGAPGVPGVPGDRCLHLGNSTFYQDSSDPGSRHHATRLGVNTEEDRQSTTDQLDKVGGLRTVGLEGQPCRTSGCAFFGSPDTNQLCSKCFSHPSRLPQASRV